MRILHAISGIEPENGGPTNALCGLARGLHKAGHSVSIVATWKSQSAFAVADALRADGIEVTLLGPTRWPFRNHPQLRAALEAEIAKADVIHIHAMWEAIEHTAAVVARRLCKPYVWTPHGMLDRFNMQKRWWFKTALFRAYLRRDLSAASLLHVASDFEQQQVARHGLPTPVAVIGLGVSGDVLRAVPPDRPRDKSVLFLGRVQRGKGLELLIPAMAGLSQGVSLIVAGPDEGAQAELTALAVKHGVADRVRFVGMLDSTQKIAALCSAGVMAAPSAHENFGVSIAEALACGTPVVVSDQVGLASLIQTHDLGRVVPLQAGPIAMAVGEMLKFDPARSARSQAVARAEFDWDAIVGRWVERYSGIASRES